MAEKKAPGRRGNGGGGGGGAQRSEPRHHSGAENPGKVHRRDLTGGLLLKVQLMRQRDGLGVDVRMCRAGPGGEIKGTRKGVRLSLANAAWVAAAITEALREAAARAIDTPADE